MTNRFGYPVFIYNSKDHSFKHYLILIAFISPNGVMPLIH